MCRLKVYNWNSAYHLSEKLALAMSALFVCFGLLRRLLSHLLLSDESLSGECTGLSDECIFGKQYFIWTILSGIWLKIYIFQFGNGILISFMCFPLCVYWLGARFWQLNKDCLIILQYSFAVFLFSGYWVMLCIYVIDESFYEDVTKKNRSNGFMVVVIEKYRADVANSHDWSRIFFC